MDPILETIDAALRRKGLSDAAASKLAVGHPSLIKNLRMPREGEKRYNLPALMKLADILELEFYFGPPRETGPVENIAIDGANYAHIPLHDALLAAGSGYDNITAPVITPRPDQPVEQQAAAAPAAPDQRQADPVGQRRLEERVMRAGCGQAHLSGGKEVAEGGRCDSAWCRPVPLFPPEGACQPSTTGILPILACQTFGPSMWAEVPPASTATVTGMSTTSNS